MRKTYGYVCSRFSGQDTDNQMIALLEMQVPEKDIFIDKQEEGSSDDAVEYHKLLERLKADDLLYIKSLDALGVNYREIEKQWRMLTKEKKADVVVLDMPQLDTRRGKTQFDTLVADIVLSMLEYAPNAEKFARKQKQKEGIDAAKSRGVQFGRPELELPENFDQTYRMWRAKEINGETAAKMCHMSKSLFYLRARRRKEDEENG